MAISPSRSHFQTLERATIDEGARPLMSRYHQPSVCPFGAIPACAPSHGTAHIATPNNTIQPQHHPHHDHHHRHAAKPPPSPSQLVPFRNRNDSCGVSPPAVPPASASGGGYALAPGHAWIIHGRTDRAWAAAQKCREDRRAVAPFGQLANGPAVLFVGECPGHTDKVRNLTLELLESPWPSVKWPAVDGGPLEQCWLPNHGLPFSCDNVQKVPGKSPWEKSP